jgi:hypothetical protein
VHVPQAQKGTADFFEERGMFTIDDNAGGLYIREPSRYVDWLIESGALHGASGVALESENRDQNH